MMASYLRFLRLSDSLAWVSRTGQSYLRKVFKTLLWRYSVPVETISSAKKACQTTSKGKTSSELD